MNRLMIFLFLLLALASPGAQAQTLLPNGQQQFTDSNGQPLAGGSVYFYVPGTTTAKFTYQNPALTTPNTNPVVLNSAGRAVVWGSGLYREVVYDSAGNLIWDQLTTGAGSLPVAGKITTSGVIASCSSLFPVVASAPLTLTFPTVPRAGDTCTVVDAGFNAGANNITVNFGGNVTNVGSNTDTLATNGANRTYVWLGSPAVWQVLNEDLPLASQGGYYAVDSGAVNALAVTISPAPVNQAALIGVPIRVLVGNTNTVNVPTLNVNGFGAKNIETIGVNCTGYNGAGQCTVAGASTIGLATLQVGRIATVVYDGGAYQLLNQVVNATPPLIQAGVDGLSPVTSLALAGAQPGAFSSSSGRYQTTTGMIVQWGVYTPTTGNQDVFNFPAAFTTHGVSIVANSLNGASNVDLVTISFNNNSQAIVSDWEWNGTTFVNISGHAIHWIAIGY